MMRRLAPFAAVLVVALAAPAGASALTTAGLQAKLSREMRLAGARGGAYVQDISDGRVLFTRRADVARPPASVEKLYTTSTALLRFGPDASFTTSVLAAARPDAGGILRGGVWLRGGGDPTLTTTRMGELAAQLADAGVTSIPDGVAGDGTLF